MSVLLGHNLITDSNEEINLLDSSIIDIGKLQDIFLMDSITDDRRSNLFDHYSYNGLPIPRVTTILQECIAKDFLIKWAARLGEQQYIEEQRKARVIGTIVHDLIETYLKTGEDGPIYHKDKNIIGYAMRAYSNFKSWLRYINSLGYHIEEIIAIEYPVVCPYYGGTIDCIVRINGKVYIVDFKTSKYISYEYIIQTSSYMWIVNNYYQGLLPHIDGIGIIRIDKEKEKFEDVFLNEGIPAQKEIIDQYIRGFGAILYSYYSNLNMRFLYQDYKKVYNINNSLY